MTTTFVPDEERNRQAMWARRQDRLDLLTEEYEPDDSPESADAKWLLIEKNVVSREVWFSLHDSPEAAGSYHDEQEFAEDWEPRKLVDLDNGDEYGPVVKTTFSKDAEVPL